MSRRRLVLDIDGKTRIPCHLKRHLAPRTVGTIMRALPLEGHAHMMGSSILYFETHVGAGTERKRTEFKKGDVAFLASSGSICFFVGGVSPSKVMTPIGRLDDDYGKDGSGGGGGSGRIDALKSVRQGSVLRLYEVEEEAG